MSLTIRMRRALAAFRADPNKPMVSVTVPHGGTVRTISYGAGGGGGTALHGQSVVAYGSNGRPSMAVDVVVEDSTDWKIHSDYHRSRVIHGKRLNWHINGKGKQSAQYGTTMYYGSNVRQLFRGLGLKDTW